MALEAVQAQAGHASIESTRIYLHLTNDADNLDPTLGGADINEPSPGSRIPGNVQNFWLDA